MADFPLVSDAVWFLVSLLPTLVIILLLDDALLFVVTIIVILHLACP